MQTNTRRKKLLALVLALVMLPVGVAAEGEDNRTVPLSSLRSQ